MYRITYKNEDKILQRQIVLNPDYKIIKGERYFTEEKTGQKFNTNNNSILEELLQNYGNSQVDFNISLGSILMGREDYTAQELQEIVSELENAKHWYNFDRAYEIGQSLFYVMDIKGMLTEDPMLISTYSQELFRIATTGGDVEKEIRVADENGLLLTLGESLKNVRDTERY